MVRNNLKTIAITMIVFIMIFIDASSLVIDVHSYYGNTQQAKQLLIGNLNKVVTIEKPIRQPIVEEPETHIAEELSIEEMIGNACDEYGIDYDVVLAIARLETGWFKSEAYLYGNNPGGLSINEVPMAFDTKEEGVDAFVSNLATNYFALGLNTPEEIGTKYCPVNPGWAPLVRELMAYEY